LHIIQTNWGQIFFSNFDEIFAGISGVFWLKQSEKKKKNVSGYFIFKKAKRFIWASALMRRFAYSCSL
jgi:hypothetical protein